MTQSIYLGNTKLINFNNQEVEILQLNGVNIWEKSTFYLDMLNFVGIDASGNYEGTTAFDGTIVEYAVGRPIYTTAEDGTITIDAYNFEHCGALRKEYFVGYEDKIYAVVTDTDKDILATIIPKEIVIPSTYNGLPVTAILSYAFYGFSENSDGTNKTTYCGSFINKIIVPKSINKYLGFAFINTGYYDKIFKINYYSPPTIKLQSDNFITVDKSVFEATPSYSWYSIDTMIYDTPHIKFGAISDWLFNRSVCEETVTKFSITSNMSLPTSSTEKLFVFKNSTATFEFNIESQKSASYINIYTDNQSIRNYDWSSKNITPTFYALNEYTGAGA